MYWQSEPTLLFVSDPADDTVGCKACASELVIIEQAWFREMPELLAGLPIDSELEIPPWERFVLGGFGAEGPLEYVKTDPY
jgi:hypothetical protein